MAAERQSRPFGVFALLALMLLQGVSGIAGGIGLIADPTGAGLGIPQTWLAGSPFPNYLIPGIILLVVLGIAPLVVVYGLWVRKPWAWPAALAIALALLIWIGVEILVIGYQAQPPLQLIYGAVGVLMLIAALVPAVREYYAMGGR